MAVKNIAVSASRRMAFGYAWMECTTVRIAARRAKSGSPIQMARSQMAGQFKSSGQLVSSRSSQVALTPHIGTANAWLLISESNWSWLTGAFTFNRSPLGATLT